jgi:poly(A) polymerase
MAKGSEFVAAMKVAAQLREAGYGAYLAGGCVRDLLLGREPKDFDVATSARPDAVLGLFQKTFAVGAKFGVVLVVEGEDEDRIVTEVATFRSDGAYADGRRPDVVRYTDTAEEDVQRRDFTINGLMLDPFKLFGTRDTETQGAAGRKTKQEKVRAATLDFVGGLADLEAGVVRAIGNAAQRFEEDQLRLLRAVRFAARFGFEIEPATHGAMQAAAPKIATISRERIRDELTRMLTEGHARRAFELLDRTGLLIEVLPEIAAMKGVEQPPQFHPEGDVWTHTLMLLEQLEAGCPLTLAWGALLHDVGKPPTYTKTDRVRFNGHVEVGVAMGAEICRRFRFSNDEAQMILALIQNHMRFADAPKMKTSTLKRFFRLEHFEQHLALHKMDCMAASGNLDNWNFAREHFSSMTEEVVKPKLLLTGRELIAAGYKPGAAFKKMLRAAEDAQLEGTVVTAEEALALVRAQFGEAEK